MDISKSEFTRSDLKQGFFSSLCGDKRKKRQGNKKKLKTRWSSLKEKDPNNRKKENNENNKVTR